MKMMGILLRTSPGRFALIPLAAFLMFVLFKRNNYWIGIWPEAGAAVATCAFFASFFAAGLAALDSARHNTHRMREPVASTRPGWVLEGLRMGATVLWIWSSYAVAVIVAMIVTSPTQAPGVGFFFGYILLGLFVITFAAFWGWAFGRFLTPAFAASASFLSWFVFSAIFAPLSEFTPFSAQPSTALNYFGIVLNWVALLGLGACFVFLASRLNMHRVLSVSVTAGAAVLLLAVISLVPVTQPLRPAVADPMCVKLTIEYCFWPEHKKYLQLAHQVDARVESLPISWEVPARVVESGLQNEFKYYEDGIIGEREGTFDSSFAIQEGNVWSLADGVKSAMITHVTRECVFVPELVTFKLEQLGGWLEYRLAGGGAVPYTTNAVDSYESAWAFGRQMTRESEDAQGEWADSLLADILNTECESDA